MANIIDKGWNGYKFTYMGDLKPIVFGREITKGTSFNITERAAHLFLNELEVEDRDNFVYEKVILSNYGKNIF